MKKSKVAENTAHKFNFNFSSEIDFDAINSHAKKFAKFIESNFEQLAQILLTYESFEVVNDELERTLDLLNNLEENQNFFKKRIGAIASFLPRNQPLYAFSCFVLVPSYMATEVHFRIPHSMKLFFPELLDLLQINKFFPNVFVSKSERLKFLEERSALLVDEKSDESIPVSDVVIFTGTSAHAERLRLVFDQRTLFIMNGSGHNPLVVSNDANIEKAVEATLKLQLYNQGQDCAAPNSILVHKKIYQKFLEVLKENLKKIKVGKYSDRSCKIGPISDPDDLVRIQELLIENRHWLDSSTPGIINATTAIVEPTIICKPLEEGGNFTEVFAPLMFIQKYDNDKCLSLYFESPHYPRNAMYVTLYGSSEYINNLPSKKYDGKVLHPKNSILINKHLHVAGVERGTQPYGGCGIGASSISINGEIICKPTLPQRDIFEQIAMKYRNKNNETKYKRIKKSSYKIHTKDIRKLLSLKVGSSSDLSNEKVLSVKSYFDAWDIIASDSQRYIEFTPDKTYSLLLHPNAEYIATIQPKHIHQIKELRTFLKKKDFNHDELKIFLYSVAKNPKYSNEENKKEQLAFFKNIYQLLLAKDSGPRLVPFLMDADREIVLNLLDV